MVGLRDLGFTQKEFRVHQGCRSMCFNFSYLTKEKVVKPKAKFSSNIHEENSLVNVQLPAVAYIRLPFYEAKVLFSEGCGRM